MSTDRGRWQAIDSVFQEALDLAPGEWADFLDRRCTDDPGLRTAVQELLEVERRTHSFLEESLQAIAPDEIALAIGGRVGEPDLNRIGERVGVFRIVRQIGRGGMAGVYEAARADGEFEQRVAIKFLRRGLDTEDFVQRFLAERQILSSLEHANIARLVDGGTTAGGLPYLALEYVEGVPITDFCDVTRCTLEQRLRLFIQVARAVQHAHASLVVHRDIKPSNILVTPNGQAKLLDFGIAKLLSPDESGGDSGLTRTGFRPLTPEYASPEQARGETITTASDVYQLGVLLFRLVTGQRPYEVSTGGSTLEETVTTVQPRVPSEVAKQLTDAVVEPRLRTSAGRLSRRLRGDVDTIVLKALRKEPERRYATAAEMADDLERHLDGLPISARRESSVYRTAKFLRRHAWVTPVSGAAALLVGGYVFTLVRHGRELEEERNVARDVQQAFVSFFTAPDSGDVGLGEGRRNLTILQAIEDGTDRVRQELADRPAARAELFDAMSAVLQDLDEPTRAYELATEALEIERGLYGERSRQVNETLLLIGKLTPDPDSARAVLAQRLDLSQDLYGSDDPATAVSLQALAELDLREGKLQDAVDRLESAIDIYRASSPPQPRRLAAALALLAENLGPLDRADDAMGAAREAYDLLVSELGPGHSETASAGIRLAGTLTGAGRYDEARQLYESSLTVMDAELGPAHSRTMSARNNYAILLRLMGDLAGAERAYRRLLDPLRERYGDVDAEVAAALQNLATVLKDERRYVEAEELSRQAYEMFEETRGRNFFQTAFPLLTISEIRLNLGDYTGAEAVSREALELLSAALPPGHFATSVAQCRLGEALAGQGKAGEARRFLESGSSALAGGDRADIEAYKYECLEALAAL